MDNVELVKEEIQRGKGEVESLRIERLETYLVAALEHMRLLDQIVNPDGLVLPREK